MGSYRIYEVATARVKPGNSSEAVKWWNEKGKPLLEASPGTKWVKAFTVQFGLGGEYHLEIWREIDSYGSYDKLDEDMFARPEEYEAFSESFEFMEWGPTRLMGEWPESQFVADEE